MDQNNNTPPPDDGMVFRPVAPQEPTEGEQARSAQPTHPVEQMPQPPTQPQSQYTPPSSYTPNAPQQGYAPPQNYQAQSGYPPGTPQQPGGGPGVPPAGYQPQSYPPAPPIYNPVQPAPRKGGIATWLLVLLGVLVLACAGIFVVLILLINSAAHSVSSGISTFATAISTVTNGLGPGIAASTFSSSLQAHNYAAAHGVLGPDLAKQYSVSDLQTKWKALEDAQGTVTSDMSQVSIDNNNAAHVTWTVNPTNGRNYDVELTLQQVGQDWLITSADPTLIPEPVSP